MAVLAVFKVATTTTATSRHRQRCCRRRDVRIGILNWFALGVVVLLPVVVPLFCRRPPTTTLLAGATSASFCFGLQTSSPRGHHYNNCDRATTVQSSRRKHHEKQQQLLLQRRRAPFLPLPPLQASSSSSSQQRRRRRGRQQRPPEGVLDVEFERSSEAKQSHEIEEVEEEGTATATTTRSEGGGGGAYSPGGPSSSSGQSLLDLSLEMGTNAAGEDWNKIRVPFVSDVANDDRYIDVKLAFTVRLDGQLYGIGKTFDHAAAVVYQKKDGTVVHMSPDDEESDEYMNLFASQLREHVGSDLRLIRTPRIVTIRGPLDKYIADWEDRVLPPSVDTATLLDDSDEDLEHFHEFMKKEMGGESEYAKLLNELDNDEGDDDDLDELARQVADLFQVPGVSEGDEVDREGFEGLLNSSFVSPQQDWETLEGLGEDLSHDGVALKLVGYQFRKSGKAYSLVHPLQPYVLIGRYVVPDYHDDDGDDNSNDGIRFEMLSKEEEKLLIPKLEQLCREDLEKAGFAFQ